MMKKWKKIVLIVFLIVVVAFALYLALTWPIYPSFMKRVDTYDELSEPFENSSVVFLPREDEMPAPYYQFLMDGRNCLAKPIGYAISKQDSYGEVELHYGLNCGFLPPTSFTSNREYGGIAYSFVKTALPTEDAHRFVRIGFFIDGVFYDFTADYKNIDLSDEEADEMNVWLEAQLYEYVTQVVDQYNAKAQESGT